MNKRRGVISMKTKLNIWGDLIEKKSSQILLSDCFSSITTLVPFQRTLKWISWYIQAFV